MKKILLYTLIAISVFGTFLPIKTFAQTPSTSTTGTGICYFINAGVPSSAPSTQAQCNAVSTQHEWLSDEQVRAGVTPSIGGSTGSFQKSSDQPTGSDCSFLNPLTCVGDALSTMAGKIVAPILSAVFWLIQQLMSLWLGLAGIILNTVIKLTIIDMSTNISNMDGINIAWKTIKDVTNIVFIFLLLYEAILIILSISSVGEVRKLITNIVIAALLVNFSLFFTKVLIDASNVITVGVYEATVSSASGGNNSNPLQSTGVGLSGALTNVMGLQTWEANKLEMTDVTGDYGPLVTHIMTSILYFITGFIFLAVSVMFVVRYIVLVILLALSPLAYLGTALPQLKSSSSKWWSSLRGQLLFPPAFMLMMWVALIIMSDKNFLLPNVSLSSGGAITTGNVTGAVNLFFNFALVIGMVIAAMITSKQLAIMGDKQIEKMINGTTKFAGNTLFGTAGWAGRNSFGRIGKNLSERAALQRAANEGTGASGAAARLALYASKKARSASFDARNATIPTSTLGDLIEGTAGRTRIGKAMGLNDVQVNDIEVGSRVSDLTGLGVGGTKGYKELKEESSKRIRQRETEATTELKLLEATEKIMEGAKAGASAAAISDMEKELSKLSDKQTETLVSSNRELLNSLNFANAISVKQLEAINKSEQFTDDEKDNVKNNRFSNIINAMSTPGAIPPTHPGRNDIKALTDSELEMIDSTYLDDPRFVAELRGGQIDSINKSNKFSRTQKTQVKDRRKEPLLNAINNSNAALLAGNPALALAEKDKAIKELQKLSPKEIVALGPTREDNLLISGYTPNTLKRMAQEMTTRDIQALRTKLTAVGNPHGTPVDTLHWLNDPNTGMVDFS